MSQALCSIPSEVLVKFLRCTEQKNEKLSKKPLKIIEEVLESSHAKKTKITFQASPRKKDHRKSLRAIV